MEFTARLAPLAPKPEGSLARVGTSRMVMRGHLVADAQLADGCGLAVDGCAIREYDPPSGRLRRTASLPRRLPKPVQIATVTGDLFWGEGSTLHAWRRATGIASIVCELPPGGFRVSPDGSHVAVDTGNAIAVLRCADGTTLSQVAKPYDDFRSHFHLATGGAWVLFAEDVDVQSGSQYMNFVTIDLAGRQVAAGGAFGDAARIYLSTDGASVVTVDAQVYEDLPSTMKVWHDPAEPFAVDSERALALSPHGLTDLRTGRDVALAVGFDLKGWNRLRVFALAGGKAMRLWDRGQLVIHDLATGQTRLAPIQGWAQSTVAAFERCGRELACYVDGRLWILSGDDLEPSVELTTPEKVHRPPLAVAKGRVFLASASYPASEGRLDVVHFDGATHQIDLPEKGIPVEVATSDSGQVAAVRTGRRESPNGPLFAVTDGVASVVTMGNTLATAVWSMAVRPDGHQLAFATTSGVTVWDLAARREIRRLLCEPPAALAYSADGQMLYASEMDTTITVWDLSRERWERSAPNG